MVSCVADGKGLEFLHPIDLYTSLAIQWIMPSSVKNYQNGKASIDVLIHRQHRFLIVQIVIQ
ncbi:MAG: hypothetical protein ACLTMH_16635 [Faecalimonas umbilicata]|uniref:hypothetical protein n=1 Tax=Faecalimonas umbilicata TaxID=1912855 RepID=UPI0039958625